MNFYTDFLENILTLSVPHLQFLTSSQVYCVAAKHRCFTSRSLELRKGCADCPKSSRRVQLHQHSAQLVNPTPYQIKRVGQMQLSSVTIHHVPDNEVIVAVKELPREFSNTGRLQAITVRVTFLLGGRSLVVQHRFPFLDK